MACWGPPCSKEEAGEKVIEILTVPLEDRPSQLYRLAQAISKAGVEMKALFLSTTNQGRGEVRLIVTNIATARAALDEERLASRTEQAVAVEVPDRTGGLASILQITSDGEVSIRVLFTFITRIEGKALAVGIFDDNKKTEILFQQAGLTVVDQQAIRASDKAVTNQRQALLDDYLGGSFFW